MGIEKFPIPPEPFSLTGGILWKMFSLYNSIGQADFPAVEIITTVVKLFLSMQNLPLARCNHMFYIKKSTSSLSCDLIVMCMHR